MSNLLKENKNGWETVTDALKSDIFDFCEGYKNFINESKTERLAVKNAVKMAEENGFVDLTTKESLKAGDKVSLVGFGVFDVKERSERVCKNPRTGEEVICPATRVPGFKAGKGLKDAVAE